MLGVYERRSRGRRVLDAPDRARARAGRDCPQPRRSDPRHQPGGRPHRAYRPSHRGRPEAAGYLTRTRIGRRTRYTVNPDSPFRHKAQEGLRVGPLLDQLTALADVDTPRPETARQQPPRTRSEGFDPNPQIRRNLSGWPLPATRSLACNNAVRWLVLIAAVACPFMAKVRQLPESLPALPTWRGVTGAQEAIHF